MVLQPAGCAELVGKRAGREGGIKQRETAFGSRSTVRFGREEDPCYVFGLIRIVIGYLESYGCSR